MLTFSLLDYAEIVLLSERNVSIYLLGTTRNVVLSPRRLLGIQQYIFAFVVYILSNLSHHFQKFMVKIRPFSTERRCYGF